jgi:hypothetical protein
MSKMAQTKEEIAAYHREYNKKKREEKAAKTKAVPIPRPEGDPVKTTTTTAPTIEESKKKLLDSFLGGLTPKQNTSTGTGPATGSSPTPVGASPSPTTPAAGPARPVTLVIPPHIFTMIAKTLNRLVDSNIYPTDEDTAMMLAESMGACMVGSKPMSPWMSFAFACFIAYGLPTVLNIDVVMKRWNKGKGDKDGTNKPQTGFLGGIFGPRVEPTKAKPKPEPRIEIVEIPDPRIRVIERPESERPIRAEDLVRERDGGPGPFEHSGSSEEREDDSSDVDIPDALAKKRGGALL